MQNSDVTAFDIIGDVHGMGSALERLLERLEYQLTDAGFVYKGPGPARQVIFLGDILDRGPEIRKSLAIVKKMVDNGNAQMVLGNHEFNALAYHTPIDQGFLRPRNARSEKQIKATLEQFDDAPMLWQEYLQWFKTLPLWLEFEHFRVVHACWDGSYINAFEQFYGGNRLNQKVLHDCENGQSLAAKTIERVSRGVALAMPDGQSLLGRDGFYRKNFRVDFWSENPTTYGDVVFQPDPLPAHIAKKPLTTADKKRLLSYPKSSKPLFVGHYWLTGAPSLITSNIACLDYSAVNGGKLVAYRFNEGDTALNPAQFVSVEAKTSVVSCNRV